MLEILTVLTDIALGALAYRMARDSKRKCEALDTRLTALETVVANIAKGFANVAVAS